MSDTQSDRGDAPSPTSAARPGYFIVRISLTAGDERGAMRGVLEQLGSGEKWAFRSGEELAEVVDAWARRRAAPPAATRAGRGGDRT